MASTPNAAAAGSRLQIAFLQFLEQKVLSLEARLDASEKEREESLQKSAQASEQSSRTLSEATVRGELPSGVVNATTRSVENSDKLSTGRVLELLATEQGRHEAADRARSDAEAKFANRDAELEKCKAAMRQQEETLNALRRSLDDTKSTRDAALAAEHRTSQSLAEVSMELDTLQRDLAAQSDLFIQPRVVDIQVTRHPDDGIVKFAELKNSMLRLYVPDDSPEMPYFEPIKGTRASVWATFCRLRVVWPSVFRNEYKVETNMLWLADSPHALQLAPSHTYLDSAADTGKWLFCRASHSLAPPRGPFEFFYEDGDKLYYVGTFLQGMVTTRIKLRHLNIGADTRQVGEHEIAKSLAKVTAFRAPAKLEAALPAMYRLGSLRIDVMGLRYVGFNHNLDTELRRACTGSPPKRVQLPPPEELKRRRAQDSDAGGGEEEAEPVRKRAKRSTTTSTIAQ